jgi:hypothetical protein
LSIQYLYTTGQNSDETGLCQLWLAHGGKAIGPER